MRNSDNSRLSKPHFDWPLLVASYLLALYGVLAITIANYDPTLGSDRSLQEYYWQTVACDLCGHCFAAGIGADYLKNQRRGGLVPVSGSYIPAVRAIKAGLNHYHVKGADPLSGQTYS